MFLQHEVKNVFDCHRKGMCQWTLVSKMFKLKYGDKAIVVVQLHLEGKFLSKKIFAFGKERKRKYKLEGNWKES